MEVILSIIGFSLFVTGLFGLLGNEDSSPLAVTAGLLLMFTSFCIYLFAVNDIKEYTVDKIEIISNEDKINRVTLIKDPGVIFFNHRTVIHTTKQLNIGDLIHDSQVKEESLVSKKEIGVNE